MSDGVDQWLVAGSKDFLQSAHLPKVNAGGRVIRVQPYLTRLYAYAQGLNILGVMALRVDYISGDELLFTRHYRNLGAKSNWAGGLGEYHTALNITAARTFPLLINSLENVCNDIVSGNFNAGIFVAATTEETTEIATATTAVVEPKAPAIKPGDVIGQYKSEIITDHAWAFKSVFKKMKVTISDDGAGGINVKTSPNINLKAELQGSRIKFSTDNSPAQCFCAFVEGEWKLNAAGQGMTGTWERDGSTKGEWNLTKN